MAPDSCIAFDGSWSHRRNADHCLVDFIDTKSRKVVDFEIITKTGKSRGTFEGASNAMECAGLRELIPRWRDDARVTHYVHDKDGKTRSLIREMNWQVTELIDQNHLMKSFRRKFQKIKVKSECKLFGLQARLERFFQTLVKLDETAAVKRDQWMNVPNHLAGDHSKCLEHGECKIWGKIAEANNRKVLEEFLEATAPLFEKVNSCHSTQMCESLHAVKAHFANKLINWQSSWGARVAAAILSVNENDWEFKLHRALGLPELSADAAGRLRELIEGRLHARELRRSTEYLQKERQRRQSRRKRCEEDDKSSLYKGVGTPAKNQKTEERPKRKYVRKTMGKKLTVFHDWFRRSGMTGTEADSDSTEWVDYSDYEQEEEEEEVMEEVTSEYHIPDVEEIANEYDDEYIDETESESE